jgi:hypothetical protein
MKFKYLLLPIMLIMLLALLSLAQKSDNVAYLDHFPGWFVDEAAVNIEGETAIQGCNVKVMGEKGLGVNDTLKKNDTAEGNQSVNEDPNPPSPKPSPKPNPNAPKE